MISPFSCWKGYERVPGTKKGAKGSCRKKSPMQKKKTAKSITWHDSDAPDAKGKFKSLSPSVKEALVDMYFNIGPGGYNEEGDLSGMRSFHNFNRELSNGNVEEATKYLRHIEPGDLERNLKDTEYYAKSPERARQNIDRILEAMPDRSEEVDDKVLDIVLEVDAEPFAIKEGDKEVVVKLNETR